MAERKLPPASFMAQLPDAEEPLAVEVEPLDERRFRARLGERSIELEVVPPYVSVKWQPTAPVTLSFCTSFCGTSVEASSTANPSRAANRPITSSPTTNASASRKPYVLKLKLVYGILNSSGNIAFIF